MASNISNYYPSSILRDEYKYRSIKILIKEQAALNGVVEDLKTQLEKTSGDLSNILSSSGKNTVAASSMSDVLDAAKKVKKLSSAKTKYGIALPLPNELLDSQTHQWETTTGFVGNTAGQLANADLGVGSIKGTVNSALGELSSVSGFRKPMIDPGYFQDYKGTEPRSFTFSWDFVPNNVDEAKEIVLILYNLKKFTLPTTTVNGLSLLSPYMFDLEIGNPIISGIMNMNNVVCTSMSINLSADNSLQFFADGTPKHIRLDMAFAERSTVTSDLY